MGKCGEIPTTSSNRIGLIPIVLNLGRALSTSREESFRNEL